MTKFWELQETYFARGGPFVDFVHVYMDIVDVQYTQIVRQYKVNNAYSTKTYLLKKNVSPSLV